MSNEKFECWAVVEIMGHKQIAGRVTEQVVAGQGFVRVDVPEVGDRPAFTKLLGPSAIYGITPVTEQVARLYAERLRESPVDVWALPARVRAAIEAHAEPDLDDDYQEPAF